MRFAGKTRGDTGAARFYGSGVGVSRSNGAVPARDAGVRSFPLSESVRVLAPAGELDLCVAGDLRQHVLAAIAEGVERLVVDLSEVTFVDSTALGALADAAKRLRSNDRSLAVVCVDRNILRVLEVTGLSRLFRMYGSIPEALADGRQATRAAV